MKPLTEVMQFIKQIDSVPTDRALVMYLKEPLVGTQLDEVIRAVKRIRDAQDVPITMIIPYDIMELAVLDEEQKTRIIHALGGKTASEVEALTKGE